MVLARCPVKRVGEQLDERSAHQKSFGFAKSPSKFFLLAYYSKQDHTTMSGTWTDYRENKS